MINLLRDPLTLIAALMVALLAVEILAVHGLKSSPGPFSPPPSASAAPHDQDSVDLSVHYVRSRWLA